MENRPVGREKRVISGGSGIRRSGTGLGKTTSRRDARSSSKNGGNVVKGILGLFGKRK